jgi:hypothetical protein
MLHPTDRFAEQPNEAARVTGVAISLAMGDRRQYRRLLALESRL